MRAGTARWTRSTVLPLAAFGVLLWALHRVPLWLSVPSLALAAFGVAIAVSSRASTVRGPAQDWSEEDEQALQVELAARKERAARHGQYPLATITED